MIESEIICTAKVDAETIYIRPCIIGGGFESGLMFKVNKSYLKHELFLSGKTIRSLKAAISRRLGHKVDWNENKRATN